MKKFLFFLALSVALIAVVVYFGIHLFINLATHRALDMLATNAHQHGLEVVSSDFRNVRLTSLKSAQWNDISMSLRIKDDSGVSRAIPLTLAGQSLTLHILGMGSIALEAFMVEGNYGTQNPKKTISPDILTSEGLRKGKIWLEYFFMTHNMCF